MDRQGCSQRRGAISHRQPVGLVLGQFVYLPLHTCCPNFLRLAYVQVPAPPPSFLVLARLYVVVDSCGARLHKTQHSHLPMDPLDDLHDSQYCNPSTTTDDVYKTQRNIMMPPLGAAPTYLTPSIPSPQVGRGPPFLSPAVYYGHTSRVPTPFSTDSPSDGSETSPHDPSTGTRNSTSPTPPASHVSRCSVPRKS